METEKFADRMITEEGRKKPVIVRWGGISAEFTMKALNRFDNDEIARSTAIMRGGLSVDSFTPEAVQRQEDAATAVIGVDTGPDWWDAETCTVEPFVREVAAAVRKWTREYDEKLKKNRLAAGGGKAPAKKGRVPDDALQPDAAGSGEGAERDTA